MPTDDNSPGDGKGRVDGYKDMVQMPQLDGKNVLANVHTRFERRLIYTCVGGTGVLISLNPYTDPGLYNQEYMNMYHHSRPRVPAGEEDPHIYMVGRDAYRRATGFDRMAQTVFVSGESGAGKTEASKLLVNYLAEMSKSPAATAAAVGAGDRRAGSGGSQIEERIVRAEPVLEAFGNAKTVRNDNSSRFGKFIQLLFDRSGRMVSGSIRSYLLEEGRVVSHEKGERGYNVFYQLCANRATKGAESERDLFRPENLHYLRQGQCPKIDGVDDAEAFEKLVESLQSLGLETSELTSVWRCIEGILLLGNTKFEVPKDQKGSGKKASVVTEGTRRFVELAASRLGLETNELVKALLTQTFGSPTGSIIEMPRSQSGAIDARDVISKRIYGQLFPWLVKRINAAIGAGSDAPRDTRVIGILDIFGFEMFKYNSFEQLCINYANEKLQQHFVEFFFRLELELYKAEELEVEKLTYVDNAECIGLLDKKPGGLLPLLADEGTLPKGSDLSYVQKLRKLHKKNEHYVPARGENDTTFTIKHFAAPVTYDAKNFIAKNFNKADKCLISLLRDSKLPILAGLFKPDTKTADGATSAVSSPVVRTSPKAGSLAASPKAGSVAAIRASMASSTGSATPSPMGMRRRRGGRRKARKGGARTIGTQFQKQLSGLLTEIRSTESRFVRCIKPNGSKGAYKFESDLVMRQLLTSGVIDALRVRKHGYTERMPLEKFEQRFSCVLSGQGAKAPSTRDACVAVLTVAAGWGPDWQVGKTRVFYRPRVSELLESARSKAIAAMCVSIQAAVRARAEVEALREKCAVLRGLRVACELGSDLSAVDKLLQRADVLRIPEPLLVTYRLRRAHMAVAPTLQASVRCALAMARFKRQRAILARLRSAAEMSSGPGPLAACLDSARESECLPEAALAPFELRLRHIRSALALQAVARVREALGRRSATIDAVQCAQAWCAARLAESTLRASVATMRVLQAAVRARSAARSRQRQLAATRALQSAVKARAAKRRTVAATVARRAREERKRLAEEQAAKRRAAEEAARQKRLADELAEQMKRAAEKAKQEKAKQEKAKQEKAEQEKAEQEKAEQERTRIAQEAARKEQADKDAREAKAGAAQPTAEAVVAATEAQDVRKATGKKKRSPKMEAAQAIAASALLMAQKRRSGKKARDGVGSSKSQGPKPPSVPANETASRPKSAAKPGSIVMNPLEKPTSTDNVAAAAQKSQSNQKRLPKAKSTPGRAGKVMNRPLPKLPTVSPAPPKTQSTPAIDIGDISDDADEDDHPEVRQLWLEVKEQKLELDRAHVQVEQKRVALERARVAKERRWVKEQRSNIKAEKDRLKAWELRLKEQETRRKERESRQQENEARQKEKSEDRRATDAKGSDAMELPRPEVRTAAPRSPAAPASESESSSMALQRTPGGESITADSLTDDSGDSDAAREYNRTRKPVPLADGGVRSRVNALYDDLLHAKTASLRTVRSSDNGSGTDESSSGEESEVESEPAGDNAARAQTERKQAERERKQAETERQKAMADLKQAQTDREKAEAERKKAQGERNKAETEMKKAVAELKQAQTERERATAERERNSKESKRLAAERLQLNKERKRIETEREEVLRQREANEKQRKANEEQVKAIAEQKKANEQMTAEIDRQCTQMQKSRAQENARAASTEEAEVGRAKNASDAEQEKADARLKAALETQKRLQDEVNTLRQQLNASAASGAKDGKISKSSNAQEVPSGTQAAHSRETKGGGVSEAPTAAQSQGAAQDDSKEKVVESKDAEAGVSKDSDADVSKEADGSESKDAKTGTKAESRVDGKKGKKTAGTPGRKTKKKRTGAAVSAFQSRLGALLGSAAPGGKPPGLLRRKKKKKAGGFAAKLAGLIGGGGPPTKKKASGTATGSDVAGNSVAGGESVRVGEKQVPDTADGDGPAAGDLAGVVPKQDNAASKSPSDSMKHLTMSRPKVRARKRRKRPKKKRFDTSSTGSLSSVLTLSEVRADAAAEAAAVFQTVKSPSGPRRKLGSGWLRRRKNVLKKYARASVIGLEGGASPSAKKKGRKKKKKKKKKQGEVLRLKSSIKSIGSVESDEHEPRPTRQASTRSVAPALALLGSKMRLSLESVLHKGQRAASRNRRERRRIPLTTTEAKQIQGVLLGVTDEKNAPAELTSALLDDLVAHAALSLVPHTHVARGKKYSKCFEGSEFVKWLASEATGSLISDNSTAQTVAQSVLDKNLINAAYGDTGGSPRFNPSMLYRYKSPLLLHSAELRSTRRRGRRLFGLPSKVHVRRVNMVLVDGRYKLQEYTLDDATVVARAVALKSCSLAPKSRPDSDPESELWFAVGDVEYRAESAHERAEWTVRLQRFCGTATRNVTPKSRGRSNSPRPSRARSVGPQKSAKTGTVGVHLRADLQAAMDARAKSRIRGHSVGARGRARFEVPRESSQLRVFCGTWNCNAQPPAHNDVRTWLKGGAGADVFIIGLQETVELKADTILMNKDVSAPWQEALLGAVRATAADYTLVVNIHLVGMLLLIIARASVKEHISHIKEYTLGVGGIVGGWGNKGAVAARFNVFGRHFIVLNCHLTAHQQKTKCRNDDLAKIWKRFNIDPYESGPDDVVLVLGDLNYRLDIKDAKIVKTLIEKKDWASLLEHDQLMEQMKQKNAFVRFREVGDVHFAPTFKLRPGTDEYRIDKRVPAWCDRVLLWASHPVARVATRFYRSVAEVRPSDHKPVCALLDVELRGREDTQWANRGKARVAKGTNDDGKEKSDAAKK